VRGRLADALEQTIAYAKQRKAFNNQFPIFGLIREEAGQSAVGV